MTELSIPKKWARVNISDIADVNLGKTPKKKNYRSDGLYKVVKFRDVGYEGIDWVKNKDGFVPEDATKDLRKLEVDDVLITASAHSSEHIGRKICLVNKIPKNYKNVFYCGELLGIRAYKDILNPKFVFLYFLSHSGYKEIQSRVKGVHLTSGEARNMDIPFAPYEEQGQIIEIIEQFFSDLDNAIDNLKKAKEQLKVYRQAVLKYAFEGKLTRGFEKWRKTTLGETISISSGNGLTRAKRNDDGKYFVYGGNGIAGKHSEYLFEKEKLIIGRVGAQCGNVHITKPYSWVTDNAFVVTFNEDDFDINYLCHLIISLNLNKYSSSTAQPVISQGKVYPIEIMVPKTIGEQQAIVSRIESRFSISEKMKETIDNSLNQAEALRQSILKQAFEGKLTEEWRKNNPELISGENSAKALLEKIKTKREVLKNIKKRKK